MVAYKGDYVPYRYDLRKFCAAGPISYDHLVRVLMISTHSLVPSTYVYSLVLANVM